MLDLLKEIKYTPKVRVKITGQHLGGLRTSRDMEAHSGQHGMDLQMLVDCLCKMKKMLNLTEGEALQRRLHSLALLSSSQLLFLPVSCILHLPQVMHSCSAPEGTAMTTSLRMFKFRHRIFPHPSAGITGQTPVAAFQRANSLCYPKSRLTQLQQLFSPSFPSSKISLPTQQDKILQDEIKTKHAQSKIFPHPNTKQG